MRKYMNTLLRGEYLIGGIKSAAVLAAGASTERLARFIRNIILVRVLAPDDFGIMAMIMAVVYGFKALSGVGVQQSIIQNKKGDEPEFLNSAWWFSLALGVIIFIPFIGSASSIASLYNREELTLMLQIVSFSVILESIVSPRVYALQRDLKFGRWVFLTQGSGILSVAAAIILAYQIGNTWALVIGFMVESVFRLVLSYVLCPFLPRLKIHREYSREIFQFAKRIFGLPILLMVFMQADIFVLGKMLPMNDVGIYSLTLALAQIPYMFFTAVIFPIILPIFSKIQNDDEKFRDSVGKVSKAIAFFGVPFVFFFAIYSRQILSIIYGSIYAAAAQTLTILSIYYLIRAFSDVLAQGFIAKGKPNIYRNISLLRSVMILALLVPMIGTLGIMGAAISVTLTIIVFWLLIMIKLHKEIDMHMTRYLLNIARAVGISLVVLLLPGLVFGYFDIRGDSVGIVFGVFTCSLSWLVAAFLLFTHSRKSRKTLAEPIAS